MAVVGVVEKRRGGGGGMGAGAWSLEPGTGSGAGPGQGAPRPPSDRRPSGQEQTQPRCRAETATSH